MRSPSVVIWKLPLPVHCFTYPLYCSAAPIFKFLIHLGSAALHEKMDSANASPIRGNPFKIVDHTREKRYGIVASDLQDLRTKACQKLSIGKEDARDVRVVLEQDGTEVEDDEYFSTLEHNTILMILSCDERWLPPGKFAKYRILVDEPDGEGYRPRHLEGLVDRLHTDLSSITLLGGKELELLADMDPNSLSDMLPDKAFLESLKEASNRFLSEKRQARDAMDLLKLYHCHHVADATENTSV